MKTHEMDWVIDQNATLSEIKRILGIAEALIGNGRFVLTVESDRQKRDNYLFHHFYPTAYSYEDSKLVGEGGLQSCIRSLGDYIAKHQTQEKPYTPEQVAATIGLVLPKFNRRTVLPATPDNLETATAKFISAAGPDMEPYFREGWHGCVSGVKNPYLTGNQDDQYHAWNEGWYAADRYLSA